MLSDLDRILIVLLHLHHFQEMAGSSHVVTLFDFDAGQHGHHAAPPARFVTAL
jgi:hypothetical protein